MNINELLYADKQRLEDDFLKRIISGKTSAEAVSEMACEVIEQTQQESDAGRVHGEIQTTK